MVVVPEGQSLVVDIDTPIIQVLLIKGNIDIGNTPQMMINLLLT